MSCAGLWREVTTPKPFATLRTYHLQLAGGAIHFSRRFNEDQRKGGTMTKTSVCYVGVDLGGTSLRALAADDEYKTLAVKKVRTVTTGGPDAGCHDFSMARWWKALYRRRESAVHEFGR